MLDLTTSKPIISRHADISSVLATSSTLFLIARPQAAVLDISQLFAMHMPFSYQSTLRCWLFLYANSSSASSIWFFTRTKTVVFHLSNLLIWSNWYRRSVNCSWLLASIASHKSHRSWCSR